VIEKYRSDRKLLVKNSAYKKLGIDDINAFYADKFVWSPGPTLLNTIPLRDITSSISNRIGYTTESQREQQCLTWAADQVPSIS